MFAALGEIIKCFQYIYSYYHQSYQYCVIVVNWLRLAPLNRFKASSKIFYWPFQGGTSFVDLLCFCSVLCLLCLCERQFICAL